MENREPELGEYAEADASEFPFDPVPRRERHDGWTPEKQADFISALAESGCVKEACARVGKSPSTAYRLRRDVLSWSFREAWDAALDHAISRLSDAVFSRALNGVPRPVYFQGEQIGERRYYDERLAMFLLRYRDPLHYAKSLDNVVYEPTGLTPAKRLFDLTTKAEEDAWELGEIYDDAGNACPDWNARVLKWKERGDV